MLTNVLHASDAQEECYLLVPMNCVTIWPDFIGKSQLTRMRKPSFLTSSMPARSLQSSKLVVEQQPKKEQWCGTTRDSNLSKVSHTGNQHMSWPCHTQSLTTSNLTSSNRLGSKTSEQPFFHQVECTEESAHNNEGSNLQKPKRKMRSKV